MLNADREEVGDAADIGSTSATGLTRRCYEPDEGRRSFPAISFVQVVIGRKGDTGKWIEQLTPQLLRIGSSVAKLVAACDRWTKVSGKKPSIILCYEAGYDAFWLARFLKARGIECLVVDSASMQVNRRSRRAKTDRIDLGQAVACADRLVWG
jgi:hypothetical protein